MVGSVARSISDFYPVSPSRYDSKGVGYLFPLVSCVNKYWGREGEVTVGCNEQGELHRLRPPWLPVQCAALIAPYLLISAASSDDRETEAAILRAIHLLFLFP